MVAIVRKKSPTNGKLLLELIEKKLRKDILAGILLPRERLIEKDLSERYSVNRMIIRQALVSLEKEGFVAIEPYKGASVAEVSLEDIIENFQIISMLMGFAAKLAVENITGNDIASMKAIIKAQKELGGGNIKEWQHLNAQFHRIITMRCGNKKLVDMIRNSTKFASFWYLVLDNSDRLIENVENHKRIVEAIEERDGQKISKLMEQHMAAAAVDVVKAIKDRLPIGIKV